MRSEDNNDPLRAITIVSISDEKPLHVRQLNCLRCTVAILSVFKSSYNNASRVDTIIAANGGFVKLRKNNPHNISRAFWEEEALFTDSQWEEVRTLAKAALASFGWPVEVPPPAQCIRYVEGTGVVDETASVTGFLFQTVVSSRSLLRAQGCLATPRSSSLCIVTQIISQRFCPMRSHPLPLFRLERVRDSSRAPRKELRASLLPYAVYFPPAITPLQQDHHVLTLHPRGMYQRERRHRPGS